MSIALVQFNPVVGDPQSNAIRMIEYVRKAQLSGARVVLFGELALTGYYAQDLHFNRQWLADGEKAVLMLKEAAKQYRVTIGFGSARSNDSGDAKPVWNSFVCLSPKGSEWVQNKVLLPTYGEFDEARWFQPGRIEEVKARQLDSFSVGILLCEDGWNNAYGVPDQHYKLYAQDPVDCLMSQDERPNLLINISASPDYIGKQQLRVDMNARIAAHYKVPIVMLNVVGAQDELVFGGRSFILNSSGALVHEMPMGQESIFILESEILQLPPKAAFRARVDMQELDELIKIYLQDYMKKSNQKHTKYYLGLSGGKDSTLVATVLARHLGAENVCGVLMPYRLGAYTAPLSIELAEQLGHSLGIHIQTIPIDTPVDVIKETLDLVDESLAHQNLQARIRANILWALANKTGGMVMNTTNFSEAATGYGTIGGDLLGLPLIASLPATTVIQYLRWLKTEGGVSALSIDMIERMPSAELAPGQTDEKELGAYSYIDPILESIRMHHGDLGAVVRDLVPNINVGKDRDIFFDRLSFLAKKLLIQSEFKRWYYFKTPQLTPFTWLRWKWPIANADFAIDRYIREAKESLGL
jgi:NAD+ synthetase